MVEGRRNHVSHCFAGHEMKLRTLSPSIFPTNVLTSSTPQPSIFMYTVFNENDCVSVFNNVSDVVSWAKSLDPSRLIDTNSGGPGNALHVGDVNDIHCYPECVWARSGAEGPRVQEGAQPRLRRNAPPFDCPLLLPTQPPLAPLPSFSPCSPVSSAHQFAEQGEFGGMGAFVNGHEWVAGKCTSYLPDKTADDQVADYVRMASMLAMSTTTLSQSVYTQITDVERECDGFLNMDRSTKFTPAQTSAIAAANAKIIAAAAAW